MSRRVNAYVIFFTNKNSFSLHKMKVTKILEHQRRFEGATDIVDLALKRRSLPCFPSLLELLEFQTF